MKKRLCRIIAFAACLALAVFGLVACGKKTPDETGGTVTPGGGDIPGGEVDTQCSRVLPYTLVLSESAEEFKVIWAAPYDGQNFTYVYDCNGYMGETKNTFIDLRAEKGIALNADKTINVTIVCTEPGRTDSKPTTKVLTAEGNIKLNNPKIKSIKNGILEWESAGIDNYMLKVNGTVVKSNGSDYYTSTSLDTSGYSGALSIELQAVGDGTYTLSSDKLSFGVNAAHSKMTMLTPKVTCADGAITWNAVDGAKGYRVVDLNRAVKYVYPEEVGKDGVFKLDLSEKVLVYGVYPDSSDPAIEDAAVEAMDIDYLEGEGTVSSPYLIKTAFDLRAIDYYEARYAEKLKTNPSAPRNQYVISNDITYLSAVDEETNIDKLSVAFYGTLDGNGKKLKGIEVDHDKGRWALFDEIVKGATVKNLTFVSPKIKNAVRDPKLPINASIATVAYNNGGIIDGVKVTDANYNAAGGEISGICAHNYGTVKNCEVSGSFKQNKVGLSGEACYEMAGIVLENKSGGTVTANRVGTLTMSGTGLPGDDGGTYYNVRTAAGIVAVNRKGGAVSNNSYGSVTISNCLNSDITEYGGLVAYNAGTVTKGTGTLGTFSCNAPLASVGVGVGKNDGTYNS